MNCISYASAVTAVTYHPASEKTQLNPCFVVVKMVRVKKEGSQGTCQRKWYSSNIHSKRQRHSLQSLEGAKQDKNELKESQKTNIKQLEIIDIPGFKEQYKNHAVSET